MVEYVDPFKSLNDIKRQEREALLNNPASQQHKYPATPIASCLSRRDYFAAAALPAIIANHKNMDGHSIAQDAALMAHLLIKELDKVQHGDEEA